MPSIYRPYADLVSTLSRVYIEFMSYYTKCISIKNPKQLPTWDNINRINLKLISSQKSQNKISQSTLDGLDVQFAPIP